MVFFAVGVNWVKTSVKLMKLFSPDAEIIPHYAWLEDQLGPLVPMEVVVRFDNQKCQRSFLDRDAPWIERRGEVERRWRAARRGRGPVGRHFAPDITPGGGPCSPSHRD